MKKLLSNGEKFINEMMVDCHWIFSLTSPPLHTIMDMRNNKRRTVSTHAQVNFSQSETNSLVRGGVNFELLLWGELTEKIHAIFSRHARGNIGTNSLILSSKLLGRNNVQKWQAQNKKADSRENFR